MTKPTLSGTEAVKQAGMTIHDYLFSAKDSIDELFGKGYAKEHPELVAECVRSQTLDFNNTALVAAVYTLGESIIEAAPSTSSTTANAMAMVKAVGEVADALRQGPLSKS